MICKVAGETRSAAAKASLLSGRLHAVQNGGESLVEESSSVCSRATSTSPSFLHRSHFHSPMRACVHACIRLPVCSSVHSTVFPPTCLSGSLAVWQSVRVHTHACVLSVCIRVCLRPPVRLSANQFACLSKHLSVRLFVCRPVYPPALPPGRPSGLFVCPSWCGLRPLSACPLGCPPVRLPVNWPIYAFIRLLSHPYLLACPSVSPCPSACP